MHCLRVYLKMSNEVHFWICPECSKLHITPGYKTSGQQKHWRSLNWGSCEKCDRLTSSSSTATWILLWWSWRCLCWPQWRVRLMTIMTWNGSTATARASTSSVPTERSSWPSGATTASRMAQTVCGRLSASQPPRVLGSPVTAGGTTSTVPAWSGGSSVFVSLIHSFIDHFISIFFDCTAVCWSVEGSHICSGFPVKWVSLVCTESLSQWFGIQMS